MAKQNPAELMGEREGKVAELLARARVRNYAHLHRVVERQSPGVVRDPSTVWRYLYRTPRQPNLLIMRALAKALHTDVETLWSVISEGQATPSYLSGKRTTRRRGPTKVTQAPLARVAG
jgi:hypothetical protein